MENMVLAIIVRAVERLLVVAIGGLAIYFGYRLFLSMPSRDRSTGKLELPGGTSIMLSRVGPGVFFALFGAVVIGLSFHYNVSYSELTKTARQDHVTAAEVKREFSGLARRATPADPLMAQASRDSVLSVVHHLNRAVTHLRADVSPHDRVDIEQAVVEAKRRLLLSVWDHANWGPATTFDTWVQNGEPTPFPEEVAKAISHFHAGRDVP